MKSNPGLIDLDLKLFRPPKRQRPFNYKEFLAKKKTGLKWPLLRFPIQHMESKTKIKIMSEPKIPSTKNIKLKMMKKKHIFSYFKTEKK